MDNLFEKVMENCKHKKVQAICKSLNKKFSLKSGKDVEKLCHLVYWLYIFGNIELVKDCINITHVMKFDQNYNIWTFVHFMWGLEIKILRDEGKNKLADEIIEKMDKQLKIPTKIETAEKAGIRENNRRTRIDVEFCTDEMKIEKCLKANDIKGANEYRFLGIIGLIGTMETGFFPQLNKNKEEIENIIKNYIEELKK